MPNEANNLNVENLKLAINEGKKTKNKTDFCTLQANMITSMSMEAVPEQQSNWPKRMCAINPVENLKYIPIIQTTHEH